MHAQVARRAGISPHGPFHFGSNIRTGEAYNDSVEIG
jgi:hypothetical protein